MEANPTRPHKAGFEERAVSVEQAAFVEQAGVDNVEEPAQAVAAEAVDTGFAGVAQAGADTGFEEEAVAADSGAKAREQAAEVETGGVPGAPL